MEFDDLELEQPKPKAIKAPRTLKSDQEVYILRRYGSDSGKLRRRAQAKSAMYGCMGKNSSMEVFKITPTGTELIFEGGSEVSHMVSNGEITEKEAIALIDW